MTDQSKLDAALAASRAGDARGALALLLDEDGPPPEDEAELSLIFMLLKRLGELSRALDIATTCLERATSPEAQSTWHLRRGLLHIDADQRDAALADLQAVLRLGVNPHHCAQVRASLARLMRGPAAKRDLA